MPDDTIDDPPQIIADLQRQVVQYRTERDDALAQQTAAAEVLQIINSSPGDLAPVFDALLGRAVRLCELDFAVLWTYDGSAFHPVARHRVPDPLWAFLQDHTPLVFARLVGGDRLVHIADIGHEALAQTDFGREVLRLGLEAVRSVLIVPLRKGEVLLGLIVSYRQEVRPFTDKQVALLENFATQAVIAMENARLITETREALDQQTAAAEVLGVINSSPGDLAPVFDAILEKAHTLCGASFGALVIREGELFRSVALRGPPAALTEVGRRAFRSLPDSPVEQMLRGEPFIQVSYMAELAPRAPEGSLQRALVELAGVRTQLLVALRKDDALLGFITAYRQEVRPFSDKEIALLQNFAAQAVIAMENARLITETREALEQQTATAEVLQVINSSPGDLAPVFDAMLKKAVELCAAAHGSLRIFDGGAFQLAATDVGEAFAERLRQLGSIVPYPGHPMAPLIAGEPVVHLTDARETAAYQTDTALRQRVDTAGIRSWLAVALRRDESLLGAILLHREEVRPFTDKQIALLQNFAAQAVIAMENARLITETREALAQQTATAEVLQVINSSPGDLAPVFDAILEKAHALCGAAKGALVTCDGENFRAVATRGLSEAYAALLRAPDNPPGSPPQRLLAGESLVQVPDMGALAFPIPRAAAEMEGIRTVLYVPLRKDGALLGFITAYRQEVRPFADKQIALLENFAAQAVIAMENARLLGELRARTDEIAGWNLELEARVAAQLAELERTGRLKRFLAPQLAELIVAQGDESILESHRREIVVVFCDLRGFTGFAERAEPEEVMALLRDYHAAMGPIVASFEGTLDHYAGDGIMVFFNDPLPTLEPARRAIEMAVAMRKAATALLEAWHRLGHDIGFGVGISQGYATLGQIGFAERMDYTAIGTVTNLAARLCAEAKDCQILISRRVATAVGDLASLEEVGDLSLKGLSQAVAVYNVAP